MASTSTVSHASNTTTGGRLLVDALTANGVDRVFCVPGESYLDVLDALHAHADIDVVVAKHEGAAANMAEADGKLTGRPGICFVTRGPGATHASIGVHIAQQDSTPLILFVGQVPTRELGREAFQEIDYPSMFGGIAKWVVSVDDATRIPELVARAFACATSGRPGPVVLALPEDVLSAACPAAPAAVAPMASSGPDPDAAPRLRDMLAQARRPLVLLGGSNWSERAASDFSAFVQAWNLPVACAFRRQDIFDNRLPQYAGHLSLGMNPDLAALVRDADLILAVGTRLGEIATGGYTLLTPPRPAQKLVHLHADAAELGRVYQPDLAIQSAAAPAAALLRGLEAPASRAWDDWTRQAGELHARYQAVPAPHAEARGIDLGQVIAHLDRTLPDDAIIANGAGNYAVWLHRFYRYRQPRTELAPTCGAMGYGLPAAIAAKLRHPDRTVVCVSGDGCFLMYPQELATALQFDSAVIVIVVNNGMYGTIRMHQEKRFPGRVSATDLRNPDFVALALSFGAHAERVESADAFPAAFERARAAGRPALLELRTDPRQITPQSWLAGHG
ncbi:MAG: thiamine pyrophosphate-binding protein [Bordetella sp. SCN 67-23]|nr:thiamine pyrophosphate-binding protein [Burkholderiales bacterium]ODS74357.1 MAG: thiamine pyrophosphate-binding protein [Bordetella sp. SCN 67-23]OJW89608.1 MAG: thiamine pyrophosphate-binding protein [Burkholderiales bacterium 67-32]